MLLVLASGRQCIHHLARRKAWLTGRQVMQDTFFRCTRSGIWNLKSALWLLFLPPLLLALPRLARQCRVEHACQCGEAAKTALASVASDFVAFSKASCQTGSAGGGGGRWGTKGEGGGGDEWRSASNSLIRSCRFSERSFSSSRNCYCGESNADCFCKSSG